MQTFNIFGVSKRYIHINNETFEFTGCQRVSAGNPCAAICCVPGSARLLYGDAR